MTRKSRPLTPLQINFLKLFSVDHSDEFVMEIRKVINDYLQKKIDNEMDKLFEEGKLSMEYLNSLSNEKIHQEMRERRNGKACY